MSIQATNEYVFVIRDVAESEKSGLIIPTTARKKPHIGKIISIGGLVKDPKIKAAKGKKAMFHQGVGFEIPYEDQVYLVLGAHEVIAIV